MMMIPWYYAVATFFLGGLVMLTVWALCGASGVASRAEQLRALERELEEDMREILAKERKNDGASQR